MNARLVVACMDRWAHATLPIEMHENLDDYLAGNDQLIVERDQQHRRDLTLAGGGEIA